MTEKIERFYVEEVIDLRELIQALWRKKWLIVGVTFLTGVATLLISSFLVQKSYQSAAYVTITEPRLITELEPSIQTNPVIFETSGLSELAESAELQELTLLELGVIDFQQQQTYEFTASLQGEGQLRLRVTAEDPTLAADAANTWADVVIMRINQLYGIDEESLLTLELEVSMAKANWEAAQLTLEKHLPESRLDSLELQLSASRSMMSKSLKEIDCNQLLISDIQALQTQIESQNPADILSTGTSVSMITLQQRAATIQQETSVHLQIDQNWQVDLTVAEAVVILQQFIDALVSQNQELGEDLISLENEISELVLSLEKEQYRVDQLSQERDLARQTYTALSSQLEETRITMAQEDRPAKLGANAVEPMVPSGPRILLITALAAMIGAMLAVGVVLFRNWWIEET